MTPFAYSNDFQTVLSLGAASEAAGMREKPMGWKTGPPPLLPPEQSLFWL